MGARWASGDTSATIHASSCPTAARQSRASSAPAGTPSDEESGDPIVPAAPVESSSSQPKSSESAVVATVGDGEQQQEVPPEGGTPHRHNAADDTAFQPESTPAGVFLPDNEAHRERLAEPTPRIEAMDFDEEPGVIRLRSTQQQWDDYPTGLKRARRLGADKVSVCKARLPPEVVGGYVATTARAPN
ncbi:MAG: hypothetical protein M1817_001115 [Caeruleum heppii]|nr:MAG: hypothetical protein M1817_001115 [Caeruleum heppii]